VMFSSLTESDGTPNLIKIVNQQTVLYDNIIKRNMSASSRTTWLVEKTHSSYQEFRNITAILFPKTSEGDTLHDECIFKPNNREQERENL